MRDDLVSLTRFWSFVEDVATSRGATRIEWLHGTVPTQLEPADTWLEKHIQHHLQPTAEETRWVRCPRNCGCRHEVVTHSDGSQAAVCRCTEPVCAPFIVTHGDLRIWQVNKMLLAWDVISLLGGSLSSTADSVNSRLVVSAAGVIWPACLILQRDSPSLLMEVERLLIQVGEPFIALLPTSRYRSDQLDVVVTRNHCAMLVLSEFICADREGRFRLLSPVSDRLCYISERNNIPAVKLLKDINQRITEVKSSYYRAQAQNAALIRQLSKCVVPLFRDVDDEDQRVFKALLVNGSIRKAMRALGVAKTTLHEKVDKWRQKTIPYQLMAEIYDLCVEATKERIGFRLSFLKADEKQDHEQYVVNVFDHLLSEAQGDLRLRVLSLVKRMFKTSGTTEDPEIALEASDDPASDQSDVS